MARGRGHARSPGSKSSPPPVASITSGYAPARGCTTGTPSNTADAIDRLNDADDATQVARVIVEAVRIPVAGGRDDLPLVKRGDGHPVLARDDARALAWRLMSSGPWLGIVAITRGGLVPAAVVAREFGIPGVVGCAGALAKIPDGARIRVDGDVGVVALLGRAALLSSAATRRATGR